MKTTHVLSFEKKNPNYGQSVGLGFGGALITALAIPLVLLVMIGLAIWLPLAGLFGHVTFDPQEKE